ncbi:MAG: hypothetical protein WEB67_13530, partial [Acidimicrobiia bacterium]
MSDHNQLLRGLPQVDTLALSLKGQLQSGPERVKIAREAVEVARQLLLAGDEADVGEIAGMIARSALLHR